MYKHVKLAIFILLSCAFSISTSVSEEALERFREALKLKTICWGPGNYNKTAFVLLQQHIQKSYPLLHSSPIVNKRTVSNYSLLYKITGDGDDVPYMLMAHLDVVPVGTQKWTHDPFEASIHNNIIYARGALDNKHNAFAILEAIENLLKNDFKFERSFYLFLGHDEECLGLEGAKEAAKLMEGKRLEWLLDEGLMLARGVFPYLKVPVAHVGVAEKGYLTLKLHLEMQGGHSSAPGSSSALTVLAAAVARLSANPQRSFFGRGTEVDMFRELSTYASIPFKWIYRHISWFSYFVEKFLSNNLALNAMIRTTTAITMFHSGIKDNVIPSSATAHVNHRIHPLDTIKDVIAHDKRVLNDDRINISLVHSQTPVSASCSSPSSSSSCSGYQVLKQTIKDIWTEEEVIVAPTLMTAMTDSRHFSKIAEDIYRFSPLELSLLDAARIHGIDERITVEQYARMIHFYQRLITTADSSSSSSSSSSSAHSHEASL